MKRLPLALSIIIIFIFIAGPVFSQDTSYKKVKLIRVKDNRAVSTAVIVSKIKTKVGDDFSQDILNDDLKRLYNLGFFTDISIDVADYEDGIQVTFIVEEKPVINSITFKGNSSIREKVLKKEIVSKEGDMLDPGRISQDTVILRRFYEKKGFPQAEVDYSSEIDEEANSAAVVIVVNEQRSVKIKHIFFEGNENYYDSRIMRLITTRADTLFTSGYFQQDVFQEDVEKIKAFYQMEGFLDIAVESESEYYNDGKSMDLTIIVSEGQKYLVGDISIKGNKIFAEDRIMGVLELTRNKAFSQQAMGLDMAHIQEIYYNEGYIMCRVAPEPTVNKTTGRIDIAYTIDEKRLIYVNKVEIAGNTKTKDIVIRRELRAYPGEPFSGKDVKRSKERLYNLGYFEEIAFDTRETDDPEQRDLVVNVRETKTGEFSFGGGYSSIDKLIGFASISQRNFDLLNFPTFTGGGQNLTLKAELGFVRSDYLLSWTDPWIFGFPYSLGFDFYRTTHSRERDVGYAYEEERWGGDIRVGKEFTDYLKGRVMYKFDRIKMSDVPDDVVYDIRREEGTNYLSSFGGSLTFDTRDNTFNPKRGTVVTAGVEDAGGVFGGDFDFLKYTGSVSQYFSFIDVFVLELRMRGGVVDAYGGSDHVPIYERFFAGGSNSVRGYSERGVGPRDPGSGDPIGGESVLISNAELTFPVFKDILKGAIFCDAGNVWEDAWDVGQGDYKYGAGVGIRVKTPIGPVNVDWGYPLKEIEDEEQKGRFYFSMSKGF
ncbi:MAG: outer membrane protein assembly factor BamA [Candidatus Omnitrophica bacterium]|nr:outer membrane protein assembly factor BamA [Candidatus Omnitrophota bacterium]